MHQTWAYGFQKLSFKSFIMSSWRTENLGADVWLGRPYLQLSFPKFAISTFVFLYHTYRILIFLIYPFTYYLSPQRKVSSLRSGCLSWSHLQPHELIQDLAPSRQSLNIWGMSKNERILCLWQRCDLEYWILKGSRMSQNVHWSSH